MEYIKKEELIEGEIYKADNGSLTYIMKATKDLENVKNIPEYCDFMKHGCFNGSDLTFTNATSEEKHWLNTCIKLYKFITFEEAMKTFIPEYVEAISNKHSSSEIIGTIYKTSELPKWVKGHELKEYWKAYMFHYKPSTKEAYDAQFVVKEPEFVLPEKWQIKRTEENHEIINNWMNNHHKDKITYGTTDYTSYKYFANNFNLSKLVNKEKGVIEITFEQFKKYVLKEEIVEEKVIEPLPQFKVIETIETITKVENNEGNQFFIGDEVIGSKTKIKSKIISFKYNVDKTAILAITDKTPNIGIGINHLEHYIEPKVEVEETLLDKAKKLYPVGTKFINPNDNRECVIKEKGNYFEGNNHNIYHSIANRVFKYEEGFSGCIYINNTWSKIIE